MKAADPRSKAYQTGWIHGFYSCRFDEAPLTAPRSDSHWPPEERRLYYEGFADGKRARDTRTCRKPPRFATTPHSGAEIPILKRTDPDRIVQRLARSARICG